MRRADMVYVLAVVVWVCAVGLIALQLRSSVGAVPPPAHPQVDSFWVVMVGEPGDTSGDAVLFSIKRVSALLDSLCVARAGKPC